MNAQLVEAMLVCGACFALGYILVFTAPGVVKLGFGDAWSATTRRTIGVFVLVTAISNAVIAFVS